MEKKSQVLNLRKTEPEPKPQVLEPQRVEPRHSSALELKQSLKQAPPAIPRIAALPQYSLAPESISAYKIYSNKDKSSWGFVIKNKQIRGKKLLFLTGGIVLVGILVWIISPNIPLLMVLGLAACVTMIKSYVPIKDAEVEFNDRGIRINEAFYSGSTLASFHIDETEAEFPELSFEIKQRLMPRIRIPIPIHLTSKVRNSLTMLALETEHEPTMGEMISKKLRL